MRALLLRARLLAARLLMVASIALLAACSSTGNVNWTVVGSPDPSGTPAPSSCPYGPLADGPGCQPAPSSEPTAPPAVDYVPICLPSDPPGSYCEAPQ